MIRRLGAVAFIVGVWLALPATASAHGIGGRGDLPVPVHYFVTGATVVLVLSFLALGALWKEPRLQGGPRYRSIGFGGRWLDIVLATSGVVGLFLVVAAGVFGETVRTNSAPVLVWVVMWLMIPIAGAVVGDLWRTINPWRTLSAAAGAIEKDRPNLQRLGIWPATGAFIAFTWLELVYRDASEPLSLATAALVYSIYAFGWAAYAGPQAGLQAGEAFTSYNELLGSIGPIDRGEDGKFRRRGWLRALPVVPQRPGLVAFAAAMLGSVTYDGLSATEWWGDTFSAAGEEWFGTLALVVSIAAVAAVYLLASWATGRLGDMPTLTVARSFAHTLVPIALAYAVAHYFTLVIFEGQTLFAAASDPLGLGWDLFGTADWRINFWLSPTGIWWVQLAAIVLGHVAGVILAHDRALSVFPAVKAQRTQYAMLGLMVALTGLGLVLLSAG